MEGEGDAEMARVEGGDGTKSSLAYIQLEKQNGRLKEALLRCASPGLPLSGDR